MPKKIWVGRSEIFFYFSTTFYSIELGLKCSSGLHFTKPGWKTINNEVFNIWEENGLQMHRFSYVEYYYFNLWNKDSIARHENLFILF